MFTSQVFPEHAAGPFHIAGESYAGHYIRELPLSLKPLVSYTL